MSPRKEFHPLQATEIARAFKDENVEYLFIGKSGAILLGYPGTTQDVDIFPARSAENGHRIVVALRSIGFEIDTALEQQIQSGKDFVQIKSGPFDVDLVFAPDGISSFAEAKSRGLMVDIFCVANLRDIIASKRAAGRQRDLIEVPLLENFREEYDQQNPQPCTRRARLQLSARNPDLLMNSDSSCTAMTAHTEQLKIVIVGHVDHGKSTFVGRLFHDTGSLPEGKLEQLQQVAERRGVPFEWANLMDALQSERDQNITIDTAQIWFQTKKRQYIIIDAPGHKEFLKNMITGAANAEAALLLIDANEGVQEQSRRHGYLLNLLGIRQFAVLVNKMDLQGYSQERFDQIEQEYRAFLRELGAEPKRFIPIAAKHGDNIASLSKKMPWWSGPTVLDILDDFKISELPHDQPLRFPIQDIYRFDERRILAGRVEAGSIKVGDRLLFSPSNKVSTVKTIERWNAPAHDTADAGESIGITLTEQIFVERGAVAALEASPPYELTRFKARLFWLGRTPFRKGKTYKLKLATQEVDCEIETIEKVIDASTLETVSRKTNEIFVGRHEVAELTIRTKRPIAFDAHSEIVPTGRFVIVDGFEVSGGGIVAADNYPRRTADSLHKSDNIYWSHGKVIAQQRARRNGHAGCIVWLTGLSGAGKSSIATELERELFNIGKHAYMLDGDNIRHGLCSDLAFAPPDRKENIRRVGEVARLFVDAGLICITAFISPYRSDRELVRNMVLEGQFIEVHVNAPIEVCEQRDVKGLYAKARANEIKEFTGVSAPYEPPLAPDIELRTDQLSIAESVNRLLEYLHVEDEAAEISI